MSIKAEGNWFELTPAYGRDYATAEEVFSAFIGGKDFSGDYQLGFRYCDQSNFKVGQSVLLRYNHQRDVAIASREEIAGEPEWVLKRNDGD